MTAPLLTEKELSQIRNAVNDAREHNSVVGLMELGQCVPRLLSDVHALLAANAELEARLAVKKSEYENIFNTNVELNHRVEVEDRDYIEKLEARLAASVDRDVAKLACQMAWGHGRLRFAGAGFPEHPVDPKRIWTNGTEEANRGEYREACECAAVVLARAEAEAAKPQTDKPKEASE